MSEAWIKMRVDLDRHPKVKHMARVLHSDRLRVIGGLWAVWSHFDTYSPNGVLEHETPEDIDDDIRWPGFAAAMAEVGWLLTRENGLIAPDYEQHNGPTAKRRAQDQKRKNGDRRADRIPHANGQMSASTTGHLSASDADTFPQAMRTKSGAEGEGEREGIQIQPIPDGIGRRQDGDPPALALVGPIPKPERPPPEPPRSKPPDCPHAAILALWAEVLPAMPQHDPQQWRGARADHLRARWREVAAAKHWQATEDGITYFRRLFAYVGQSRFLTGRVTPREPGKPPFTVTLAWLVKPENWAKTIEGTYHADAA